jgi:cytosine/adenosine deaminase-related metal-dependent hydrolase
MMTAGINVCLGTDSMASNPDLSVLREARRLHQRDQLSPFQALEMITRRAAIALGLDDSIGTLQRGKYADFAVFPADTSLNDGPLLADLINASPPPRAIWIAGKRVQAAPPSEEIPQD